MRVFQTGLAAMLLAACLGCAKDQPCVEPPPVAPPQIEWMTVSSDHSHFVSATTGRRFTIWGLNYDRDDSGRLLEDYWEHEWATVAEDFAEMKALGANLVRIHLQLAKFMDSPERTNAANLARLGKLLRLAEETGLYLDLTGLGCYHKQDVPEWYDTLDEAGRWGVQARFWQAVAEVCRESPAVFCYDLMNEPVVGGGKGSKEWLPGEPLGGKYFVQRITNDARGRTDIQIAKEWIAKLTTAIRTVDNRHMITVGVIPWAQIFKGAKPIFYSPEACGPLDFTSVHFYPKKGDVEGSLAALKVYAVGKPIVIEEIFPLGCSIEETGKFIDGSRGIAEGWVSFYWGKTIEENERTGDAKGALIAAWLRYFRDHTPK